MPNPTYTTGHAAMHYAPMPPLTMKKHATRQRPVRDAAAKEPAKLLEYRYWLTPADAIAVSHFLCFRAALRTCNAPLPDYSRKPNKRVAAK